MFSPNLSDAGIPSQSPFLNGLSQGADTYTQLLNAFAAPQIMKLKQQQAQEALKAQQMANQFYIPLTQADLEQKQLANQFYPQATASKIALQNMQTQYGPLKAGAAVQNALNNTSRYATQEERLAANTKLQTIRNMPQAQKSVWMADPKNQAEYQELWNTFNLGVTKNAPPNVLTPQFLASQGLNPQYPTQPIPQQVSAPEAMSMPGQMNSPASPNQLSPAQTQALQSAVFNPSGAQLGLAMPSPNQVPRGTQAQSQLTPAAQNILTPTQDQYWIDQKTGQPQIIVGKDTAPYTTDQKMLLQNMIQANKQATDPQIQRRLTSAVALSNFMYSPEVQHDFVVLSKYSGLLGKSESYIKSKLDPEEMAEYYSAKERLPLLVSGGMKGLENLPTSELGMKAGGDFLDISRNQRAWTDNPDATIKDWLSAYRLADTEGRSIAQSAQPLYQVYKFPEQQPQMLVNALSKKPQGTALIQNIGGNKAIQGSDGKWYTRQNGRLVEVQGGQ